MFHVPLVNKIPTAVQLNQCLDSIWSTDRRAKHTPIFSSQVPRLEAAFLCIKTNKSSLKRTTDGIERNNKGNKNRKDFR